MSDILFESFESPMTESVPSITELIAQAISGLRYGSVEIVIQDSRVVQIERREKYRLDRVRGRR